MAQTLDNSIKRRLAKMGLYLLLGVLVIGFVIYLLVSIRSIKKSRSEMEKLF